MVDLQDIITELDKHRNINKVRNMIIELFEYYEDALFDYQEAKEKEIENLIYYSKSIDEE